ncbi:polycomb group RING finger protein 6-like isoform X2 [Mercenaria mercenaria]|nr:polycomb group RING finger protein 6-like isoform X2 [Mercenaria mercenaria]
MEALSEYASNSSSSIMSLDKSDTNQSAEGAGIAEGQNKDVKTEKETLRVFSQISEMRDKSAMDTVSSVDKDLEKGVNEMDDDLTELNSELLSKQMSKVVTQLEKQVLDDGGKDRGYSKKSQVKKFHTDSIDLTVAENVKTRDEDIKTSDASNLEIAGKEDIEREEVNTTLDNMDNQDNMFNDVQIKVIDVPDDDDLFDFLKHPAESDQMNDSSKWPNDPDQMDESSNISDAQQNQDHNDIRKRELYRFLTANDPTQIHSSEVTPYQSGDENKSDSESSGRSGSTEELSSESDNEHEESVHQHTQNMEEIESRPITPVEEELVEVPVKVRRKPGPKPRAEKPAKKPKLEPGQLTEKTLEKLEKCKIATHKWLKDLQVPEQLSLENTLRFDIVDLNQYLTCGLCKGYLYEASTITECMHTFCKNCIVRHCMEVSLHCPVCNILIHPTDPFVHIRLDRMIQDIVYKILPNVAETEMKNIQAFYEAHPEDKPKEIKEEPAKDITPPKEKEVKPPRSQPQMVSLLLESESDTAEPESIENLEKKFVRVTGSATVANVCEFLKNKLSLEDSKQVDLFCCGDAIEEDNFTLEKIKNKFFGDEDCLMLLQYKVRET